MCFIKMLLLDILMLSLLCYYFARMSLIIGSLDERVERKVMVI